MLSTYYKYVSVSPRDSTELTSFAIPWNPVELGRRRPNVFTRLRSVCSFMFSCVAVKMLIDNCAAPPDPPVVSARNGGDAVPVVRYDLASTLREIRDTTARGECIGNDIENDNSPQQ